LNENRRAYAFIISEFLRNKEKGADGLRYIFKGFDLVFVKEVSKNLQKDFSIKEVPVVSLDENYEQAIKHRANNEPILIWVRTREASEYSSLSSTFKCMTNAFYPFQRRWERVEGVYDLFDITEWLFRENKLVDVAQRFLGSAEYSVKKKSLETHMMVLRELWDLAEKNPSLKNRLSPSSIAEILALIHSSKQLAFNDLVQLIGFEPSISVPLNQDAVRNFIIDSRKLALLLKGSDQDKRSKLAKFCENCLAGILLYFRSKISGIVIPKDADLVLQHFKEENGKGRRVWVVSSSDVEIKDYSLSSGLPKKVSFSLRDRQTKETYPFDDAWNLLATDVERTAFLEFLCSKGIIGNSHGIESPIRFEVKENKIDITFSFLEGYLFSRRNFRKEVDEV
jgi:hypothetical protein